MMDWFAFIWFPTYNTIYKHLPIISRMPFHLMVVLVNFHVYVSVVHSFAGQVGNIDGSTGTGDSWKYSCFSAASAEILLSGLYVKNLENSNRIHVLSIFARTYPKHISEEKLKSNMMKSGFSEFTHEVQFIIQQIICDT